MTTSRSMIPSGAMQNIRRIQMLLQPPYFVTRRTFVAARRRVDGRANSEDGTQRKWKDFPLYFCLVGIFLTPPVLALEAEPGGDPWLDPPEYKITKEAVEPKETYVGDPLARDGFEYFLNMPEMKAPISLDMSYGWNSGLRQPIIGFCERSFKIESLGSSTLALATWNTAPEGSSQEHSLGYLILAKRDGEWHPAFRWDGHYVRGSIDSHTKGYATFTFDRETLTLLVKLIRAEVEVGRIWAEVDRETAIERLPPLTTWRGFQYEVDPEAYPKAKQFPIFRWDYAIVSEWLCRVRDGELHWSDGIQYVDLKGAMFSVENVARFLTSQSFTPRVKPPTVQESIDRIQELNPKFAESGVCWGTVTVATGLSAPEAGTSTRLRNFKP